jgi:hypothetical protein
MHTLDVARAKHVLVELIRAAGGEWTGLTKLYKAFYLAHLYYAGSEPGYLTNWPIVRMPNGPGVESGDELLNELVLAGIITRESAKIGPYPTTTYRVTTKKLPGRLLKNDALKAIRSAVKFVEEKTATELSEITHEYSRSWNAARDGQTLNIYIDQIDDEEFSRREQDLDILNREILAAWKSGQ